MVIQAELEFMRHKGGGGSSPVSMPLQSNLFSLTEGQATLN